MSQWSNEYDIIRDLSLAQGCDVPAYLDATAADEKPPALNITEETEEDYFKHCIGDEDIKNGPDLALIQQMLKMVQCSSISTDSEDDSIIEITKLKKNINSSSKNNWKTPTPKANQLIRSNQLNNTPDIKPKRKRENVAFTSILQGNCPDVDLENNEHVNRNIKLLKPTDFMIGKVSYTAGSSGDHSDDLINLKSEEVEAFEKVEHWLESSQIGSESNFNSLDNTQRTATQQSGTRINLNQCPVVKSRSIPKTIDTKSLDTNSVQSQKTNIVPKDTLLNWEPSSMFRRKNDSVPKFAYTSSMKTPPRNNVNTTSTMFRPSTLANEYYEKFVERSKLQEMVKEDVWTRAERVMKEIDEKKILKAVSEATAEEVIGSSSTVTLQDSEEIEDIAMDSLGNYDSVRLPFHRHLLTEECIVCNAIKKNGMDIDEEVLNGVDSEPEDINYPRPVENEN